ncbi:hypothetical protein EVAR_92555_1 [Eumeta japonica]|uniref:Uncharacterized protein n=1 Tax=Eumeta variegata TaxID=151549 RepID=A0A4C1SZ68_EUMVA|nr:hypothetical protein EVAR_92555_1 [Eumeta japonica]
MVPSSRGHDALKDPVRSEVDARSDTGHGTARNLIPTCNPRRTPLEHVNFSREHKFDKRFTLCEVGQNILTCWRIINLPGTVIDVIVHPKTVATGSANASEISVNFEKLYGKSNLLLYVLQTEQYAPFHKRLNVDRGGRRPPRCEPVTERVIASGERGGVVAGEAGITTAHDTNHKVKGH